METKKTLYIIIVGLTIALISCIYLLNREKRQNNLIPDTTQLLSNLTAMVHNDIDETLGDYDYLSQWIKEDIDSFNIYAKQYPFYRSDEFKFFFKRSATSNSEIQKQLFNMLDSYRIHSKEFKLLKELLDFIYITRLQRNKLRNFGLFDGVGVDVFPKKDTIIKGEEYTATVEYFATFFETIPTMIVDGDTVSTTRHTQIFKEIPQKSGNINHQCMITFNWQGQILELPFVIEYYVK